MKKGTLSNSMSEAERMLHLDVDGTVYFETKNMVLYPLESRAGITHMCELINQEEGSPVPVSEEEAAVEGLLRYATRLTPKPLPKRFAWRNGLPILHLGEALCLQATKGGVVKETSLPMLFKQPDGYMGIEYGETEALFAGDRAKSVKNGRKGKKKSVEQSGKDKRLIRSLQLLYRVFAMDRQRFGVLMSWVFAALAPGNNPIPILLILGSERSGKTMIARLLKSLIDPAKTDIHDLPESSDALNALAAKNMILGFQDATSIPKELIIPFCEMVERRPLSGGMQFTTSAIPELPPVALVFDNMKCALEDGRLKNHIMVFETSPDSRLKWKPEAKMVEKFMQAKQVALEAILETVHRASEIYQPSDDDTPFASTMNWLNACDDALKGKLGLRKSFRSALLMSRLGSEGDASLIRAISSMMEAIGAWEGTTTQFLQDLAKRNSGGEAGWPKDARLFGKRFDFFREVLIERRIVMSRDASNKAKPLKLVYQPKK